MRAVTTFPSKAEGRTRLRSHGLTPPAASDASEALVALACRATAATLQQSARRKRAAIRPIPSHSKPRARFVDRSAAAPAWTCTTMRSAQTTLSTRAFQFGAAVALLIACSESSDDAGPDNTAGTGGSASGAAGKGGSAGAGATGGTAAASGGTTAAIGGTTSATGGTSPATGGVGGRPRGPARPRPGQAERQQVSAQARISTGARRVEHRLIPSHPC
jgi:hypothetical protein